MVDVILVEDTLSESALAYIAIALRRPGTRVAEVSSLEQARGLVERNGRKRPIVILGRRALCLGITEFMQAVGEGAAVVGLATEVRQECRSRALRAGVHALYERPFDWKQYAALVATILDQWTASPEAAHG